MQSARRYLSCFEIRSNGVSGVLNGKEKTIDFCARFVTEERDSVEMRERMIEDTLVKCRESFQPKKLTAKQLSCEFKGAYPPDFAPESSFNFWKSPPAARAKVTIIFSYEGFHQFDTYANIEVELEKSIDETEIGFLDGNEVGQGTYEIVLFGPRKKPLLDFVNNWLGENSITPKKVK